MISWSFGISCINQGWTWKKERENNIKFYGPVWGILFCRHCVLWTMRLSSAAYCLLLLVLNEGCLLPHGFLIRSSGGESSQDGHRSCLLLSRTYCGLNLWDWVFCDGEAVLWYPYAMCLSVLGHRQRHQDLDSVPILLGGLTEGLAQHCPVEI